LTLCISALVLRSPTSHLPPHFFIPVTREPFQKHVTNPSPGDAYTDGREGVVPGLVDGTFGEMPPRIDLLADVIADALTTEHLSYCGDRGSKTAKAFIAHEGSPLIMGRHALCSTVEVSYKP